MSAPGTMLAPPRPDPEDAGRSGLLPQLLLAVLCGGYTTGAALGWGSHEVALVMGDFGLSTASLSATASALLYARRAGPHRPAWVLFAISSAMLALGNGVWGWYEVVLRVPVPTTSAADFCFLLFPPPAIIGLLVLAKRPVTRAGWVCLVLDTWLIGGSLLTVSWSLALARTAQLDGPSTARTALSLAYPLLDIVLVSMVLALHFRRSAANRAAVNTAIAALALTVLCDALFTSPLLREHYHSGQVLDAGWFAGAILMAYAPWVGLRHVLCAPAAPGGAGHAVPARDVHAVPGAPAHAEAGGGELGGPGRRDPGRRRGGDRRGTRPPAVAATRKAATWLSALTPYLAAAVCTLGILYDVVTGQKCDRVVLFTGCTVVLALIVRQGIMLLDNVALTQELAQQENHFRSLVQGSSDVIMIAAPSGLLRYVSPAAQGVYGRDPRELVGTELAAHIHPDDLGRVVHEVRRFLAARPGDEQATRIECRIRSGHHRPGPAGGAAAAERWLHVESSVNRYQGGLIFNSRDITERVRLQAQLQHNASHDPLTDLPNRALFTERVGQALTGRRSGDGGAAVLYVDLDGFKGVNDTAGHQAGDDLLVQAARRLQESLRAGDTAARLGGDEFAVLIGGPGAEDAPGRERIREIADRLRAVLCEPYRIEGMDVRVGASIGVAFARPGDTPVDVMRHADLAMYRAKQAGKGRVEVHMPRAQSAAARRGEVAGRLRRALHDGDLTLLHQPVVELSGGRITGVEACARRRGEPGPPATAGEFRHARRPDPPSWPWPWPGPGAAPAPRQVQPQGHSGRPQTPGADHHDPVPGAEPDHGGWLLERAVEQAALRYGAGHRVPVTVRLPARRLFHRDVPARTVESLLDQHELPPGGLVLELPGGDPHIPHDVLERRLAGLRRLGVRIALAGFGRGHGALAALRALPVDLVKLDRCFTEGVVDSHRQHTITRGVLRIAGDLGILTVAEGLDRPDQVHALREMGCDLGTGAAFCGPLEEHRLRGSLAQGVFPLPPPLTPPLTAPPPPRPPLPTRRSHAETPVPPA